MSEQAAMIQTRQYHNLTILANSVQLAGNVVRKVAGNEIADGFGGTQLSQEELNDTLAAKINGYLMNPTGGK
jgi:hypothetical protein